MRITCAVATAVLALAPAGIGTAHAQDWPTKPLRVIVSFAPGGGADIVTRIIAPGMQDRLGQPIVIENRPGAAGTTGNEAVARADKDGTTLGMMTAGQIIAAVMNKSLRYDTATAFAPISLIGSASLIIATSKSSPAASVRELVSLAKADPEKYIFASAGFGATQHLSAELFMQTAGIRMRHVPFRSSPEAISAVLGGQVHVVFDTVSALLPQVKSGELKALAVTGKDRFPAVPELPAAVESGVLPGYDVTTWYGLFTTAGTPAPVVAKLHATLLAVLAEDGVRQRLATAGLLVQSSTPDAFGAFMAAELKRWEAVRAAAGLQQN